MFAAEAYSRFPDMPEQASALFEQALEQRGLFLSLPWFTHLAATGLEGNVQLRLYGVREQSNGNLAFVLPLREAAGRRGMRQLEGLSNWYSSLYGPVGSDEAGLRQAMTALAAAIAAERPRWDILDLHPLDPEDPSFEALLQALRAAGMATQRYFCFHNWYLDVAGRCYDDYAAGLPSRLKNTLKRKGRQLEKSGRARFEIVTGGAQLESAIAAYEQVYAASWKSPEPSSDFMPGLMRLCAGQGWLRLGIATVDNEPAAAQLWIVCAGVASIYKLAYDEKFASLSIGSLLTERLMRQVIDIDRVREVDYLTGDDAYKRDWMSHSRERCGIIAFNLRSVRGIAAAALHLGGGLLKNGLRRLRRAPDAA
ncbi:GNAT family N-acetyltransferase [Noviherbaspirillum soli]|uniref:GNAT family N-acetyltransferase n=1 Tax=Noviherbaspirillum soli TaxID=1064518 RepID=UPI00188A068A|nr:GNAT family N-acetyltransferase [Noviherbaspirillum soli]